MLPLQKARVQFLVGELRFPHAAQKTCQNQNKNKIKIEKVAKDVMLNVTLYTTIKELKTTYGVEETQLN